MKLFNSIRKLEQELFDLEEAVSIVPGEARKVLRKVGWISAGIAALAVGVLVGQQLRQRYKFNRRTPYDLYEHSGDLAPDVEFGLGI